MSCAGGDAWSCCWPVDGGCGDACAATGRVDDANESALNAATARPLANELVGMDAPVLQRKNEERGEGVPRSAAVSAAERKEIGWRRRGRRESRTTRAAEEARRRCSQPQPYPVALASEWSEPIAADRDHHRDGHRSQPRLRTRMTPDDDPHSHDGWRFRSGRAMRPSRRAKSQKHTPRDTRRGLPERRPLPT